MKMKPYHFNSKGTTPTFWDEVFLDWQLYFFLPSVFKYVESFVKSIALLAVILKYR